MSFEPLIEFCSVSFGIVNVCRSDTLQMEVCMSLQAKMGVFESGMA